VFLARRRCCSSEHLTGKTRQLQATGTSTLTTTAPRFNVRPTSLPLRLFWGLTFRRKSGKPMANSIFLHVVTIGVSAL